MATLTLAELLLGLVTTKYFKKACFLLSENVLLSLTHSCHSFEKYVVPHTHPTQGQYCDREYQDYRKPFPIAVGDDFRIL